MIALLLALAAAQEPLDEPADAAGAPAIDEERSPPYGGIAVPAVTFNSTDGLTLGLAGEFFRRPPGGGDGFVWKLQTLGQISTSLQYQSYFLGLETRAGPWQWLVSTNFSRWSNLLYAGAGGGDILVLDDGREGGNGQLGQYLSVSVRRPVAMDDRLSIFVQSWSRFLAVKPREGSLLEERAPLGFEGGAYSDLTVGLDYEDLDRWPLPYAGVRGEIDVRGGMYGGPEGGRTLVAAHADVAGYLPVVPERVSLAGRVFAERASPKPFFEQSRTGGRRRDELGVDQGFTGYGRTRTRGDGSLAALVEARAKLIESTHPFWDVELHLSAYAEEGFVFAHGAGLGPHLPSLGGGPLILWQGGTILRPFVAWGWRAEAPGAARFPVAQFGISVQDPL